MIAVYARVSTEEQAKHGYSLKEQLRLCRQKAKTNDVLEYVDEGISGEYLDRPALTKLRDDIKNGLIDKVIIYDPDRLSRKLSNSLLVTEEIEKRVVLVFVNGEYQKTPEGMLFYQMRGAIAEFEKAKITERMSHGRRQKARQGKVLRDFQVYGYDYDHEKEKFIINEIEAKIVKLIFDLFVDENSNFAGINGIAKYLTTQGIPTKRNASQWHRQVVRQILMNPVYTGRFYQNKWNTEGMLGNQFSKNDEEKVRMTQRPKEDWIEIKCPAIIEEDTFKLAKLKLENSRRRWAGTSKQTYMLSGLLRCADCGNTMTGRRAKNWGTYVLQYTDIKNTAGAKNKGCSHTIKCNELDGIVWGDFKVTLLQRKEYLLNASQDEKQVEKSLEQLELKRIETELQRIEKGKKNLLKLIMAMDDVDGDVQEQLKELKNNEKQLEAKKTELLEKINVQEESVNESVNEILDKVTEMIEEKEDFTTEEKREILRRCVREIHVHKDEKQPIQFYLI